MMKLKRDMKKMILLVLTALFAIGASAQTANSIYKKYSGLTGVSSVYISPVMFDIVKKIPAVSLQGDELDMMPVIQSFNGMYLLDMQDNSQASEDLLKEVERLIAKGKFELLMEAKDEGERVRIYLMRNKNIITDFVMLAQQGRETTFISITGNLSEEALNKAIAAAVEK